MRLLIIEDSKEIAHCLKASFDSECFETDLAHDDKKGIFLANTNYYSIILLDLILPSADGIQVFKVIRKKNPHVPIIIMSVKSEIPTKVRLLNMGADDYIIKPFSFEEILARVKTVLRRPRERKQGVLKCRNIVIDRDKYLVKKNGKVIPLTRKEFMLLELLVSHRREAVSRGSIIDHIWSTDLNPFSNTVEAHITKLRRKLGGKNRNIIKSVPGIGYRLE